MAPSEVVEGVGAAVQCREVTRLFGAGSSRVVALRDVDVTLPPATTVGLMGPSGSGKSTFLRLLAGLDVATVGRVQVAGVNLTELSSRRRRQVRRRLVDLVRQDPADNLLPHLTVAEQLARRRRPGAPGVERVLDRLGLRHRADHLPTMLSGGEQQRAAFARALVAARPLVLADEPTAHLDRDSSGRVVDAVDELVRVGGSTVVVATHDPLVVERLDLVVRLRDGAVASITRDGDELAVVDAAGRVQLPADVLAWFADGLVRIQRDPDGRSVRLRSS